MPATVDIASASINGRAYRLGWTVVMFALLLQFWSRYLPSPAAVFIVDDWANWARSSFYASHFEAALAGLQDPHRPVSMMAVEVVYRLFGNRALYWTLLSLAANSLLLLALMKMAIELTGRRGVAATAGVIFALLPNLTATYHWSTQVLNEVSCALVPYVVSGWLWVACLRRGGSWRLAISALAYGVGLFSYEAGILLPGAYLCLLPWKQAPAKCVWRMAPFAAVGLLYLAWRTTNAFGLNQTFAYPPHMQAGLSLGSLAINAWQLLHWWIGEYMLGAMLSGFQSFAALPLWPRRGLLVANLIVVLLVGWWLRRLARAHPAGAEPPAFRPVQSVLFGAAWTGAAWALILVSYTGPQLNVLPAVGISLLAGLALERWPIQKWGPVLFLPALLALVANQGTAETYRQAGILNQRLFAHLQRDQDEWSRKEILLIDTRGLRQRLTPGFLTPMGDHPRSWAMHGITSIRGFTPYGMVQLVSGQKAPAIRVLLDVEHGARIEGEQFIWHEYYNPAKPHTNALADVHAIDYLAVGQADK